MIHDNPRLCRNHSFAAENADILNRCSWCSDPVLLWEHYCGQQIKHGNLRPKKATPSTEEDELPAILQLVEEQEVQEEQREDE